MEMKKFAYMLSLIAAMFVGMLGANVITLVLSGVVSLLFICANHYEKDIYTFGMVIWWFGVGVYIASQMS